jgi:hypothetical protein
MREVGGAGAVVLAFVVLGEVFAMIGLAWIGPQ